MTTTASIGTSFERLRGAVQAETLAQLPEHVERLHWDAGRIRAHQASALRSLLRHSRDKSPFHRARLDAIDIDRFDLSDIATLPVMTKADMMASLDDVFTDRRLSRDAVNRALADTTTEPRPIAGDYTALASGGSSGQRGLYAFDRQAWVGFILSVTRPLVARLLATGGPPAGGLRIAMVCAPSAVHATGSAAAWTTGGRVPIHYIAVPVTQAIDTIVDQLNRLQPATVCGYPSVLARLAVERRKGRLRIEPHTVTTTSETVTPELRQTIAAGFGAPIVDVFGSSEGLIGVTPPDDDVLVFNSDMCIIELVDGDHRPVAHGLPSEKVLVTNLYNRIQPLIRYELDDCFIEQPNALDSGHLRARVHGRPGHVLQYGNVTVHPIAVDDVMERASGVLDYQVRQTPDGMSVDALAFNSIDPSHLAADLTRALERAGLRQPCVTVHIVDQLDGERTAGRYPVSPAHPYALTTQN